MTKQAIEELREIKEYFFDRVGTKEMDTTYHIRTVALLPKLLDVIEEMEEDIKLMKGSKG